MTASVARLALAIATISLKLSILGSCRNCDAPPDSEIAVATSVASSALVAPAAANAASHSCGPGGTDRGRDGVEDRQGDHGGQAELGEVERALDARLAVIGEEGQARPEEAGREVLGRRQEEQPDDARQLAQRERVAFAQEVDLDDVGLAEVERQGRERPRDRERRGQRGQARDDRDGQADRNERDEGGEGAHADRGREPCGRREAGVRDGRSGPDRGLGCVLVWGSRHLDLGCGSDPRRVDGSVPQEVVPSR